MKLIQCSHNEQGHLGLLTDDSTVKLLVNPDFPSSTIKLLQRGSRQHVLDLIAAAEATAVTVKLSDVKLLAPITSPDKVLCIGMNYVDHCAEQNMPVPTEPVVFNKFPSCIVGPGDDVKFQADVSAQLDWEVELAIVIGQRCRNVGPEEAMDYIFGYTVAQDVSARDWQLRKNGGQWLIGKAMDTFCPLGPCIATADTLDPRSLRLWCRVNGETQQKGSTEQLVFNCNQVVSHLSCSGITLLPGDVILTGTPPGVGVFRKPPVFLKPGDVVECEVEGIGSITNKVVAV